ncbi:uncharacterized protein H6S33_006209 [Morchella sextelata]|uniref:uncharacterized protein n=1 Tax=Morchella sextelata TaxID=1174677 RepID=UPI001D04617C|nr:uncharacterized protein H6S33_006209 [Morchella sextelata]KAH0614323.1 hypothetical protein H6S33_006209 [Morchella sextelata]
MQSSTMPKTSAACAGNFHRLPAACAGQSRWCPNCFDWALHDAEYWVRAHMPGAQRSTSICPPETPPCSTHNIPGALPRSSPQLQVNNRGDRLFFKCSLNACEKKFQRWPHECIPDASRRQCKATCTTEINGKECLRVFKNITEFKRHFDSVHIGTKFDCTEAGCHRVGDYGFTRRDNLIDHMRAVHRMTITKSWVRFGGRTQDGTPVVVETTTEEIEEGMDEEY